jgi:predicted negative regulator of RcsB-dependent stress response
MYRFVNHLHVQQKRYWTGAIVLGLVILSTWASFEYQNMQQIKQAKLFYTSSRPLDNDQISIEERNQIAQSGLEYFINSEGETALGSVAKLYLA